MRRAYRLTVIQVAAFGLLAACGPSLSTVKAYVVNSPRRTVALMPFSIADRQANVIGLCQNSVRERLQAYGFKVLWNPSLDRSAPALGPHLTVPTTDQVLAYGRALKASVVLIGRIEQAQEQKLGKDAVYKDQKRWVSDGRGGRIELTERVVAQPEKAAIPADFRLELGLINMDDGTVLWHADVANKIPNWPLVEVVPSCSQEKISELAEAYLSRKL